MYSAKVSTCGTSESQELERGAVVTSQIAVEQHVPGRTAVARMRRDDPVRINLFTWASPLGVRNRDLESNERGRMGGPGSGTAWRPS